MAKSVRKLMGLGSYTSGGRVGNTWYCMSDGRTECTDDDYRTVENNLITALGEPQYVDKHGCRFWHVPGTGLIYLPLNTDAPYKYVHGEKACSAKDFEEFKKLGK